QRPVVIAGGETAGDGRRRQGGPTAAAAAVRQAVHDAVVAAGRIAEILLGHLDGLVGDLDAGVAGGAEGLDLGDGDGPFVEVAAVLRRDITPAAARGLGVVRELGRPH